jgi:hypothetical protein
MQRKSSARQKAVTEPQRGAGAPSAGRTPRGEIKAPPPSAPGSGEMTLGGHVDRGLTLASLYDIGVLDRLRLEVRVRLIADVTQSLAWLHANPRLMAAHPHLLVTPSTIVIGLDGVARVDVRSAKKKDSDRNPAEMDYFAPEVLSGHGTPDLRADIYSVGVLTWEALSGKRLGAHGMWSPPPPASMGQDSAHLDLPAALGGGPERDPLRRHAAPRSGAKPSPGRSKTPPPLTLPEGGEWATGLAELALSALRSDPVERPQDCRALLAELERVSPHLATTQEIAEVVQGISTVQTLCIPEPKLPDVDAACQIDAGGRLGFMDRQPCSEITMGGCAQRPAPVVHRVVGPAAPAAPASPEPAPVLREPRTAEERSTVERLGAIGPKKPGLIVAGLICLALLGLLAGYMASFLGAR